MFSFFQVWFRNILKFHFFGSQLQGGLQEELLHESLTSHFRDCIRK